MATGQAAIVRLLEIAPDAMIVVGADGEIRATNRQAALLFDYQPGELIHESFRTLVPAEIELLHDRRLRGDPGLIVTARRKDGTSFPIQLRARGLRSGRSAAAVVAIRSAPRTELPDTTPEQALDVELIASMSHDLRTPLNSIIGFAELMHRGRVGELSPEHHEYMGDILASGQRLQRLINDLLELARFDAGQGDARLEDVELGRLVSDVHDVVRGLAASRHVHLEMEAQATPTPVLCDPVRVKQILTRLVSRALKLTPEKGRLNLTVETVGPARLRLRLGDGETVLHPTLPRQIVIETGATTGSGGRRWPAS